MCVLRKRIYIYLSGARSRPPTYVGRRPADLAADCVSDYRRDDDDAGDEATFK